MNAVTCTTEVVFKLGGTTRVTELFQPAFVDAFELEYDFVHVRPNIGRLRGLMKVQNWKITEQIAVPQQLFAGSCRFSSPAV